MLNPNDIGILADDLTGACDAAACFASFGGPVDVYVEGTSRPVQRDRLTVLNLQCRLLSPDGARARARSVAAASKVASRALLFLKIDAALRGPVGAVLEGLLDVVGPRKVIVAPALPALGKTTVGGVQFDQEVPIDQTVYAADPATPVRTARVAEAIACAGAAPFEVRDAESDVDLHRIVSTSLNGSSLLFVGSLGLADAVASRVTRVRQSQVDCVGARPARGPLIVCGSAYARAMNQIEASVAARGARVAVLEPEDCLPDLNRIEDATGTEGPLIIRIAERTAGGDALPGELIARFSAAAAHVAMGMRPDGLGLIGGETAYQVLHRLDVKRLVIRMRVAEAVACGQIADGPFAGIRFATKGGSVGPADSVIRMIDYLRGSEAAVSARADGR